MKPQIRTNRGNIGNEVFVRLPDTSLYPSTFLTADASASAGTYTTKDASFLAANNYFITGVMGYPSSEVNQVASASATVITLSSSSTFAHAQSTKVFFIPFNQVRIEKSTDGGLTYSTLATESLKVGSPEHFYNDLTGSSTDYYRARFYNSTSTNLTDPSDGVIATGYDDNTVFAIKKRAIESSGMKLADIYAPDALVTDSYLNESLFEMRRTAHRYDGHKKWSFRQEYDYNLGQAVAGTNRIALPTDMDNTNGAKNLYQVRIGDRSAMTAISKAKWNEYQVNRHHTTLAALASIGATSVTLTNSGDFDESGAGSIIDGGTQDDFSYTANTESTGVLSGVTEVTASHIAGKDVWQNPGFGLPIRYTVFGGYIYFDCPISVDYHGQNIYIDYYKKVTPVNSDNDTLEETDYDMFVPALKAKIRQGRNLGVQSAPNDTDPDWREYTNRLKAMADSDVLDRDLAFIPSFPA